MAEEKIIEATLKLNMNGVKEKLKEFESELENINNQLGMARAGKMETPSRAKLKSAEQEIIQQQRTFRTMLPPEQYAKLEKEGKGTIKNIEDTLLGSGGFKDWHKNLKDSSSTLKDFKSNFAGAALQIGNILEGLSRGSLTQTLGGITGLGSIWGKMGGGDSGGGVEGAIATGVGAKVGTEVGKQITKMGITEWLTGVGTSVLKFGAAHPVASIAGLAYGVNYMGMLGKAQENFQPMQQAYMGMMRAEDMLAPAGGGIAGMQKTPFREQWAFKMASQYGVGINEVTAPTSSFMMQGGKAGAARGVVEQAIQMQNITGVSAQTFSDSVARMERWVPKGDFSKAIASGFTDAQRYGLGGLARSGEWYSAQSQIVELLGKRGGWQQGSTESTSRSLMLTMAQYGYGGAPGAGAVSQIAGSLPGMMADPMKAAAAYSIFGLTPMQMLRPGKAGPGGKTGIDQILSVAQTPAFRQMMGGEMGAGMFAMGMGWDPELFMRMQQGEKLSPQKQREMLGDKSALMAKDPVVEEQRAQNDMQLQKLALSNDFLSDIAISTKIAAAALMVREEATIVHGQTAPAKFLRDALTESSSTFGDYGKMHETHITLEVDKQVLAKAVHKSDSNTRQARIGK